MFAFAGIWDAWMDRKGDWLQSFAIIITEPNELMASIHPQMPVIVHRRDYDGWLSRDESDRSPLDLLRPYETEAMDMTRSGQPVPDLRRKGPMAFHATTTILPRLDEQD